MYNMNKLHDMMCAASGSVKGFCRENDLVYTTIRSSMESSVKFGNMPITNAFKIAKGLNITVDELMNTLED